MKRHLGVTFQQPRSMMVTSPSLKKVIAFFLLFSIISFSSLSLAEDDSKYIMPINVVISAFLYSPSTEKLQTFSFDAPNEIPFQSLSVQKGDLLVINSYAYGDVIDTMSENTTQGIENVTISFYKVKNCGEKIETKLYNQQLQFKNCNILVIDLTNPGIYAVNIHVETIANDYSDIFFDSQEVNNDVTLYFSVGEPATIQAHKNEVCKINFFNFAEDGSKNVISTSNKSGIEIRFQTSTGELVELNKTFKDSFFYFSPLSEKIPDDVVGYCFYWDNEPTSMKKTSHIDDYFCIPDSFELGSTHTLHYAYLYADGCPGRILQKAFTME